MGDHTLTRLFLITAAFALATTAAATAGTTDATPEAVPNGVFRNQAQKASSTPPAKSPVRAMRQAREAFASARADGDALGMFAAARQVAAIGLREGSPEKQTEGTENAEKDGEAPIREPKAMLEAALAEAGDGPLAAMIEEEITVEGRGREPGPLHYITQVDAYDDDRYRLESMVFEGGEWAEVAIIGDGDTDLDLYVYDEFGNLICASEDAFDDEYCEWVPAFTGPFLVVVRNYGDVYNEYELLTN